MGTAWLLLVWVLMCCPTKGLFMSVFGGTKSDNEELQQRSTVLHPNHNSMKTLGLFKSMDSMSENQVKVVLLETNAVETHTSLGHVRLQELDSTRKLKAEEGANEITATSINATVATITNGTTVGGNNFVTGAIKTVVEVNRTVTISNRTEVADNETEARINVTVFVGNQTVASSYGTVVRGNAANSLENKAVATTNGTVVAGNVKVDGVVCKQCC
ncbi:uncharacterized protein LOC118564430 [Fundulus heteroclitus]|uniref:uncharacterized protein LOC118564430 n=1 Tax=Fundulus heteroclitus TaxID=8078 RepID=UPI00165C7C05|nr:uncharacterized protein LOC118564430 [Fundulus heteroclitus]